MSKAKCLEIHFLSNCRLHTGDEGDMFWGGSGSGGLGMFRGHEPAHQAADLDENRSASPGQGHSGAA